MELSYLACFLYVHGKLTLKRGVYMLDLFVLDAVSGEKVSVVIRPAAESDLVSTQNWQTNWRSSFAAELPNKTALSCAETDELLGLMSYDLDQHGPAVEIIYVESARHSNANLLHAESGHKRCLGIARRSLPMPYRSPWTRALTVCWCFGRKPAIF